MSKILITKYLHDDYNSGESVEWLTQQGLSVEDAELIAAERPWYEIGLIYEFDTDTKKLSFLAKK